MVAVAAAPGWRLTRHPGPLWKNLDSRLLPPFQERIFLTVSNYIFTAIFVGEMTLKVVLGFTSILPTPPPGGPGREASPLPLAWSLATFSQAPEVHSCWALDPGWSFWDERGGVSVSLFSNHQTQLERPV